MVRMSKAQFAQAKAQFALFEKGRAKGVTKPRVKKKAADLPENQIESLLLGFLRCRRWHVQRVLAGVFKTLDGKRFVRGAEKGTLDWFCFRGPHYFVLETKGPGEKPSTEQAIWIEQARREGIIVRVEDDYDAFVSWYDITWGDPRSVI